MGTDKNSGTFPEAEAWAASMPQVREQFTAAFPKKAPVTANPQAEAEAEYQRFAKLDLSNMGR
ncbi:MAG: hypothetical protein GC185_10115 [Alphaproteobacteria bacterium]|nr:hypothetical protein [Alphaproteobacteria bacterium]